MGLMAAKTLTRFNSILWLLAVKAVLVPNSQAVGKSNVLIPDTLYSVTNFSLDNTSHIGYLEDFHTLTLYFSIC